MYSRRGSSLGPNDLKQKYCVILISFSAVVSWNVESDGWTSGTWKFEAGKSNLIELLIKYLIIEKSN